MRCNNCYKNLLRIGDSLYKCLNCQKYIKRKNAETYFIDNHITFLAKTKNDKYFKEKKENSLVILKNNLDSPKKYIAFEFRTTEEMISEEEKEINDGIDL